MNEAPEFLPDDFPSVVVDEEWGTWWRVHSDRYGPWFFSSDRAGRPAEEIGRFDLREPWGTIYVAENPAGAVPESARAVVETHQRSQLDLNQRRVSQISLARWHGLRVADFTATPGTENTFPAKVEELDRRDARPWAAAAHAGGFAGILYRLRQDPLHRRALALFGDAGAVEVPDQPFAQPLPVALRNELLDLFDGQFLGDPLAQ